MRRAVIIFLITLSMIINGDAGQSTGFRKVDEAFSKYDVECLKYNVSGYVNIKDVLKTREDFEAIVPKILSSMNLPENDASVSYDDVNEKISVESPYMGGKLKLTAQNNIWQSQEPRGCTLILDITQYKGLENIYGIGKNIKAFLEKFASSPCVNFCITGYKPGKIPDSDRDRIMNGFMEVLGARKLDSINSEGIVSICGYSDILQKPIEYKSSLMNVNIGSRYDSFDDMTYFLIGTPIINEEY